MYPRVAEVPVRRRVQADGDVPRHGRRRPDRRAVLRQGRPRRPPGRGRPAISTSTVDGAAGRVADRVLAENDRLAGQGMRVLAVARRDFDPASFDPAGDLLGLVDDLDLLALVGIVDPPRKEAKDAIALCKDAGIRVRMITGDHATTAAAIAGQLGIDGRALTGAEFAAMSDDQPPRRGRRHRRRGSGRARGQGSTGQRAQAAGKHRGHDRRRCERRARTHPGRHRRGHGDHRHRGHQGRGRDDPDRRQLRHDRDRGRGRPGPLRQPDEVRPGPDDHGRRLHPDLSRRRHLHHRQRHSAAAAADPVDQLRGRRSPRRRPRLRRTHPGTHEATPTITGPARHPTRSRRSAGTGRAAHRHRHPGGHGVGRGRVWARRRHHHGPHHGVAAPHRGRPRVEESPATASSPATPSPTAASTCSCWPPWPSRSWRQRSPGSSASSTPST